MSNLPPPADRFAATSFAHPFRRYQRLALEAFDQMAEGDRRAYLVLPPGAGKTALGLEVARRIGRRTLVLCPNTAVQAQWIRQWGEFAPPIVEASADARVPGDLTILTYQAISVLDAESDTLDDLALAEWREAIRSGSDLSEDQATEEIDRLARSGGGHYAAELARFRRRARTAIARGGDRAGLIDLLHPNGRALIETMKALGPWTIVLDECHHLLAMWGYLVRALVEEIGDDTWLIGLTATPPADLGPRERALYEDLFGAADFGVPTPAVVKEGDLAPYQELAYLTRPLAHEADYIHEQHVRFQELLLRLLDVDFASVPFREWLRRRVEDRRSRDGAELSWGRFERDQPDLAQAALRFYYQFGIDPPEGARLAERHRRHPTAEDWVALIEDYCLKVLKLSADDRDAAAWEEIRRALPSLGYLLTRQGIRSHVSPVDRVLALSGSKAAAAIEILAAEGAILGDRLRALILCDYERAGSDLLAKLRGVLDPQAGSAILLLRLILSGRSAAALHPILMTARTVACSRATAIDLAGWIADQVPDLRGQIDPAPFFQQAGPGEDDWADLVALRIAHPWWRPRRYVPLLTRYFEEGYSRCLVGTRGLLGEGWDAKRVNVLIDLTAAGTATSVHQLRGRSLRLDPDLPRKVADNWDVVCVMADHPKGTADYDRFVRKHRHYYAPTIEGEIESGVSHVSPHLSPFGPPPGEEFGAINREMLDRAADRAAAYDRWGIGQPYANQEAAVVRIRFGRSPGLPGRRLIRPTAAGAAPRFGARLAGVTAGTGLAGLAGALTMGDPVGALAGLAIAAGGSIWIGRDLSAAIGRLTPGDVLTDLAAAVADALAAAGLIGAHLGAESVRVDVQSDGYYRCLIAGATTAESRLFTECLDELCAPLSAPRYLVPRYIAAPPRSAPAALAGLIARRLGRAGEAVVYHAVPTPLAANRKLADTFLAAWHRQVGPGRLLYRQDPEAQAILEVQRGHNPFDAISQMRSIWV